jgi:hypothetical protein
MIKRFFILTICILLIPLQPIFAQTTNELSISSYRFKYSPPLQYQDNRLYITIQNSSSEDFIGNVSISYTYNNQTETLGDHLQLSIVQGETDTVWFDGSFPFYTDQLQFTITIFHPDGEQITQSFEADILGDNDADGIHDQDDPDDDNDGLTDEEELAQGTYATDPDTDDDGVLDSIDEFPLDITESKDNDGDGIGDNADLDDDNDGLTDQEEIEKGSDPLNPDSDEDGLKDGEDEKPNQDIDKDKDSDNDGITDYEEITIHKTDINNPDTDKDGLTDKEEIDNDLDPNDNSDANQDYDDDGVVNSVEIKKELNINEKSTHIIPDNIYIYIDKILILILSLIIVRYILKNRSIRNTRRVL